MVKKELSGAYRCHIFILLYNLEFIKRDLQNSDTRGTRNAADLPPHSSLPHSAFIHPISANKPILSTLTAGFIPSTLQAAIIKKRNIHNSAGTQNYTHTHSHTKTSLGERHGQHRKSFFFILKGKNNPNSLGYISSCSICLRPDKHGVTSSDGWRRGDLMS